MRSIPPPFKRILVPLLLTFLAGCGSEDSILNSSSAGAGETESDGNNTIANLVLGDVQPLAFSEDNQAVLNFEGGQPNDQYLLIINSSTVSDQAVSVTMNSDSAALSSLTAETIDLSDRALEEASTAEEFHRLLRDAEKEMATLVQEGGFSNLQAAQYYPPSAPTLGSINYFNVLSSLSSLSQYSMVKAKLRYISSTVYVYVDLDTPSALTDADIKRLAYDYEAVAVPYERKVLGSESDVNKDGHITILMTPVINRMASTGGMVTGFFYPGDLVCTSGSGSNCQEIFYTFVPDPDGKFGNSLSVSFVVDQILPGVLAHEYEHMISFNQRVLVQKGSVEIASVEEWKAHLFEDLTGFPLENFSRVKICLNSLSKTSLVGSGSPGLAARGCGYLFLRYLYEQSADGEAFLRNLVTNKETGVANLEKSFAGTSEAFDEFPEFYNTWTAALSLTNTGLSTDSRFNYQAQKDHPQTGLPTGVCLICAPPDSRGTILTGPPVTPGIAFPLSLKLSPTTTQMIQVAKPSKQITLQGSGGAPLSGWILQKKTAP
ncbi:MAG: hypothetical protein HYS22_04080 [Deltaproteobacteria bacterium]|nr:hypothetical protein [Deltaproteobacteria bacterium]